MYPGTNPEILQGCPICLEVLRTRLGERGQIKTCLVPFGYYSCFCYYNFAVSEEEGAMDLRGKGKEGERELGGEIS